MTHSQSNPAQCLALHPLHCILWKPGIFRDINPFASEVWMHNNTVVWLTRAQLSTRTGFAEKTLRNWASQGKGPKLHKFGNRVRYHLTDVEAWEATAETVLAA
ncbi:helix-turn-helix transcriptional regulator [Nocardia sp. NPDC056611]|uniref:helix-turn-helix transcriptional regulator n=1 Tax=Nocardia sp. NPDC056611 TaxID=3345877 RepID=UPI00366B1FD5